MRRAEHFPFRPVISKALRPAGGPFSSEAPLPPAAKSLLPAVIKTENLTREGGGQARKKEKESVGGFGAGAQAERLPLEMRGFMKAGGQQAVRNVPS